MSRTDKNKSKLICYGMIFLYLKSCYLLYGKSNSVEIARVISVGKNGEGITHVRYEVSLRYSSFSRAHDSHILALFFFSRQYLDYM
jgi:hypothetical protein